MSIQVCGLNDIKLQDYFCNCATPWTQSEDNCDDEVKVNFRSQYKLGDTLGKGAFSTVRIAMKKNDDIICHAVKIIEKSNLSYNDEVALKSETEILKTLNHPRIIKMIDFFDEPNRYYVVTEFLQGGELLGRIISKNSYSEKETRDVCRVLFETIQFIHEKKIAHRDLKPENLLLKHEDDDSDLKIADFGFAKYMPESSYLTTQCGTPEYVAPEIITGIPYNQQVDMWSMGVIMYILLCGYPPFVDDNRKLSCLYQKVRIGKYEFHKDSWDDISDHAKDLVTNLLNVNAKERFNVEQALNHDWFRQEDKVLSRHELNKSVVKMKKFITTRKFRAAVRAVILTNKLKTFSGKRGSLGGDNVLLM